METYQREGVYPGEYPFTPGTEAMGVATAVGTDKACAYPTASPTSSQPQSPDRD